MLPFLIPNTFAQPSNWEFNDSQGIVFLYQEQSAQQQFIAAHWAYDNQRSNGFGSLDDIDNRVGHITITLPNYQLQAGTYILTSQQRTERFDVTPPSQILAYSLPTHCTGIIAYNQSSFAYAAQDLGVAFLPKLAQGTSIPFQATESYLPQPTSNRTLSIQKNTALREPTEVSNSVLFPLLPISLLLLWGLFYATRSLSKKIWLPLLVGFAIIIHALPIAPNLLLVSEVGFDDPPTSASLLHAIGSNPFSPISQSFSYPEGHNWLIMGPSWLAYVLCTPLVWMFDGVRAHNIGIALLCAALFWSITRYGKHLGLSKPAYVFAGLGGVLAPVFLNELDKLSLDRAFLFPIPLLLLFIQKPSFRYVIGGISAIALLFYGQFYYGIFLGAALPLMMLHRLHRRYIIIAVGGLLMMLPGLFLLQSATSGTLYDAHPFTFLDPLSPINSEELQRFVQKFDPRQGSGLGNRPMETAKDQLMTAIVNSVHPKDILFPSVYFCGQSLYWIWIALALLLVKKRKQVFHTSLDVLILSVFSMGPFLRTSSQELIAPLPFYFYQLQIPSFSQLKHPDRFAPMAAIIAAIPLAFLLDFVLKKISHTGLRWICMIVFLIFTLQIGIIKEDHQSLGDISVRIFNKQHRIGLKKLYVPKATQISHPIDFVFPKKSAVSLFPQTHPIQREQYIPFLSHHIPMQNPPPHGEFSQTQYQLWAEKNRILNGLAYLSASNKVNIYFGLSAGKLDLQELLDHGLTHIVIHIPDLIDPIQQELIEDFLQPFSTKVHADPYFEIYALGTP